MIHKCNKLIEADHKIMHVSRVVLHISVYLAFDGVGLVVFSTITLNLQHKLAAYAISFLMIFAMYNMNRYPDTNEDMITHNKRPSFVVRYGKYMKFSSIAAVILSLIIGYITNIGLVYIMLLSILIGVIYSFKLIPKSLFGYERLNLSWRYEKQNMNSSPVNLSSGIRGLP